MSGVDQDTTEQTFWRTFRNDSGETIPGCGIVRIYGAETVNNRQMLLGKKPNGAMGSHNTAINDIADIPSGAYGRCCLLGHFVVLYDSADGTPTFGEVWGPSNGSWKAKKNKSGFRMMGNPSTSNTLVEAQRTEAKGRSFGASTTHMLDVNGSIQWATDYGGQLGIVQTSQAAGLSYNGVDLLWAVVGNAQGDNFAKFDLDGTILGRYFLPSSAIPLNTASDEDHVYITSAARVEKFDNVGVSAWSYTGSGGSSISSSSASPVWVDASGNVYVSANPGIQVLNSAGSQTLLITTADQLYCVTTDAAGNIYAGMGATTGVRSYDSAGVSRWNFSGTQSIRGIAVEPTSGDIAFGGDTGGSYNLWRVDSAGNIIWRTLTGTNGTVQSVAFDSDGNLYVGCNRHYYASGQLRMANTVRKYSPTGSLMWIFDTGPGSAGGAVQYVRVDENDNVYISGTRSDQGLQNAFYV